MKTPVEDLESYVSDMLHAPLRLQSWPGRNGIPGYLRNQYEFYEGNLLETPLLFVLSATEQTARSAGKHTHALQTHWPHPVVFVFDRIAADTRQRLIRAGIPFVVPKTQLYLPMLAVSLRERFHPRPTKRQHVSPSAQAVLLHALLRPDRKADTPTKVAGYLGYSVMAMVRAISQLEAAGLVSSARVGRERSFTLAGAPLQIWKNAQPFLASPVKRHLWFANGSFVLKEAGLNSGLNALAEYSSLAATPVPTRALAADELKARSDSQDLLAVVSREEADMEIEMWTYPPKTLAEGGTVDRLSLYLALREDNDERVQQALDEMIRGVAW